MTESEAIEAIQFDLKIGGEIHSQVLRDAIDVAIQALEKQIPMEPVRKLRSGMGNDYKDYYCACGRFIGYEPEVHAYLKNGMPPFSCCCGCGRKIDWSDELKGGGSSE